MTTIEDPVDWTPEPEEYAVIEAELRCPPRFFELCELERDEKGELLDTGEGRLARAGAQRLPRCGGRSTVTGRPAPPQASRTGTKRTK